MPCQWCGDHHGADQLCQRAQRGMTRRSFFGLLGAGVAGAAIVSSLPWVAAEAAPAIVQPVVTTATAVGRRIYISNAAGTVYKLIDTINDNTTTTWTDDMTGFVYDNLPIVGDVPIFGETLPVKA